MRETACFTSSEGPSRRRLSHLPANGDLGWRGITLPWKSTFFFLRSTFTTCRPDVQVCVVFSCLEFCECKGLDNLNAVQ